MLEVTHLACERGERVLFSALNFTLEPGEVLQIGGANGSGKTSLLRLLSGLSRPTAGQVQWRQTPVPNEIFRKELLYLGHQAAVKEDLSPLENLRIANALAGQAVAEEILLAAVETIGLADTTHLPSKHLSQGQKRRVALARLFISDAPLWILDEPLTALDQAAVQLIQNQIAAHLARQGCVVLTTHQNLEVPGVAPRRIDLN